MKIISVNLKNFGSYKELSFPIKNQGLTIIQGPTGSGKSTLCDAIPWVLFGITAKGGKVDEIRNWSTKEDTIGSIVIKVHGGDLIVAIRTRGLCNDFSFSRNGIQIRGKDLADTQRLFNENIGFSSDLYLAGAYFHEFSQTASFFTTTAKNRRLITEQLVDLSLANKLTSALSNFKSASNATLSLIEKNISDLTYKTTHLTVYSNKMKVQKEQWALNHEKQKLTVQSQADNFETRKQTNLALLGNQLRSWEHHKQTKTREIQDTIKAAEALIRSNVHSGDEVCKTCGQTKESIVREQIESDNAKRRFSELSASIRETEIAVNPYEEMMQKEQTSTNLYREQYNSLDKEINPNSENYISAIRELKDAECDLRDYTEAKKEQLQDKADFDQLQDITTTFRSLLIQNTINHIQISTNDRLAKHFDGELRVNLEVLDTDKLNVIIHKDGNECSYPQLSKGQRQLLKLCFGVAVMEAVQEHHGIKFNCAFFDEALDGLDSQFKTKAFNMLQSLETKYENLFVVEHSTEIKALANNTITVKLENGASQIE